jgi:hypothetical protein
VEAALGILVCPRVLDIAEPDAYTDFLSAFGGCSARNAFWNAA